MTNSSFRGVRQPLDDLHFVGCIFEDCEIVYSGGSTILENCAILPNCTLTLEGPAAFTVRLVNFFLRLKEPLREKAPVPPLQKANFRMP